MTGPAPLLAARGVSAGYGKLDILHDVSLEVSAGEIVSIIGPNGAGKSTAFKTIVGFLRPRQGRQSEPANGPDRHGRAGRLFHQPRRHRPQQQAPDHQPHRDDRPHRGVELR